MGSHLFLRFPPVVVVLCEGIVKPNAEKGSKAKRIELKRSEWFRQGSGQQSDQRERVHRADIEKTIDFTAFFVVNPRPPVATEAQNDGPPSPPVVVWCGGTHEAGGWEEK